jgi:pyruvate formate lyase activating enzyme
MAEARKDVPFYGAGGGLTLTGGEATMQPELAEALLRLAKAEGIATALETAGHTQWSVFARLTPYLDDILFDVKHVDETVHRSFAGIGCGLILDNLRQLVELSAPVTVRVPLIPGFNTSLGDARAIAATIRQLDHPGRRVDLLPYHALGAAKYRALGRDYPWAGHERLREEEIEALVGVFTGYGLDVRVGG